MPPHLQPLSVLLLLELILLLVRLSSPTTVATKHRATKSSSSEYLFAYEGYYMYYINTLFFRIPSSLERSFPRSRPPSNYNYTNHQGLSKRCKEFVSGTFSIAQCSKSGRQETSWAKGPLGMVLIMFSISFHGVLGGRGGWGERVWTWPSPGAPLVRFWIALPIK